MKITFTGDPMDGKEKVIAMRPHKRFDEASQRDITTMRAIKRKHKADDPDSVVKHGVEFPLGKAITVSAEFAKEHGHKFADNSHFKVEGASKPKAKPKAAGFPD